MKIGVVVGRFQTPTLTEGHLKILNEANNRNEELVIVIGEARSSSTDRNPMNFDVRKPMLQSAFPNAKIIRRLDQNDDDVWSQNLDSLFTAEDDVTLYCSRDGFKDHYSGKHPIVEVDAIPNVSATTVRNNLQIIDSPDFRAGVIYNTMSRFPIVYSTVDMAIVKFDGKREDIEVILGRKHFQKKFVFFGGFVDTSDLSFKAAALRELSEEFPNATLAHDLSYVDSFKIDDWRYRNTKDSIMTTLFTGVYKSGELIAGDDIEEVKAFKLSEAHDVIAPHHLHLLEAVKEFYL